MLLIAIPKSASTSIMSTIGELHTIEAIQQTADYKHFPKPNELKYLHNLHSDIREFNKEICQKWVDDKVLYKQHIFPSRNNVELLRNTRKVVLLRDPHEVILAYQRGVESGIHKMFKGFKYGLTSDNWLDKCKKNGLFDDLLLFYNGWKEVNDENTLIVEFEEFKKSPAKIIRSIEVFFDLELTKREFEVHRKRYSKRKQSIYRKFRIWIKKKYTNTIYSINLLTDLGWFPKIKDEN
ncbi:sulfotransferase domain-containing protein [Winogradskyella poriferorum]|uniref:sulfotransferase domain-containing protein n=1 Tax=Winogradskyella poriferorum TaxID=307627 RepID=UPI003D64D48A